MTLATHTDVCTLHILKPPGWDRLSPLLQPALDRAGNTHALSDVLDDINRGNVSFLPGEKSALVFETMVFPLKTVLTIWLAGGDLNELVEMYQHVERFARQNDVNEIKIMGRPGWVKSAEKQGFQPIGTVLSKDL